MTACEIQSGRHDRFRAFGELARSQWAVTTLLKEMDALKGLFVQERQAAHRWRRIAESRGDLLDRICFVHDNTAHTQIAVTLTINSHEARTLSNSPEQRKRFAELVLRRIEMISTVEGGLL